MIVDDTRLNKGKYILNVQNMNFIGDSTKQVFSTNTYIWFLLINIF